MAVTAAAAAAATVCSLESTTTEAVKQLRFALQTLLKDKGFQIPSPLAREAHLFASEMLEWLATPANCLLAAPLCQELTTALYRCIPQGKAAAKSKCEKMWGKFHSARTMPQFKGTWMTLMQRATGKTASPIFYQYITDVMFREIVKQSFPADCQSAPQSDIPPLDYHECNALRYAAGYVPRSLRKRLEKGSHPLKRELVMCLIELSEDDGVDEESTADWSKAISRGGITLVNNKTYQFFYAIEMRVRQHFSTASAPALSEGSKETLIESIATDEDVLFFFSIVSAEWEPEVENILLRMLTELWVTIRGFSFTSSWMEMYKQAKKKTVQKSKGVRKQLLGISTSMRAI